MPCYAIQPPHHYNVLVDGAEGVRFLKRAATADVVHAFARNRRQLDRIVAKALSYVADGGMLWVSWPKKASPMFEDLTEDGVREAILPTGWVDVKVCAVDEDWSALKFLRRR